MFSGLSISRGSEKVIFVVVVVHLGLHHQCCHGKNHAEANDEFHAVLDRLTNFAILRESGMFIDYIFLGGKYQLMPSSIFE